MAAETPFDASVVQDMLEGMRQSLTAELEKRLDDARREHQVAMATQARDYQDALRYQTEQHQTALEVRDQRQEGALEVQAAELALLRQAAQRQQELPHQAPSLLGVCSSVRTTQPTGRATYFGTPSPPDQPLAPISRLFGLSHQPTAASTHHGAVMANKMLLNVSAPERYKPKDDVEAWLGGFGPTSRRSI